MGRRREWTGWLLWSAFFAAGGGYAVLLLSSGQASLSATFERYFPAGGWATLVSATVVVSGLAVVLSLIEQLLLGRSPSHDIEIGSMSSSSIQATIEEVRERVASCIAGEEPNVPGGMDELFRGALILNASDIHLNPLATGTKATFRIDGVLHQVCGVPPEFGGRLAARVKVLAHMDSFTNKPQDGSLRRRIGDIEVEARVSALPSNHGERIVMRLVRGGETVPAVSELGFERDISEKLEGLLQKPQGMIYVSGPVGSGKTTTLYSALQHLHSVRGDTTSLVTLEDPIELQLPYATQTQINAKHGMSFAQTLRSVLRQDPGALMLGEIRDRETAEIATQAGLTGHLILTTIHVQSAAGTFARLMEMDVEPFILASSCVGTLAQRLVRGLCVECRKEAAAPPEVRARFTSLGIELPDQPFFEPVGCPICEGRGYSGRLPIVELLVMSEAIRGAVHERAPSKVIHELAVSEGMVPLATSGLRLAMRGSTSLLEVLRVAG